MTEDELKSYHQEIDYIFQCTLDNLDIYDVDGCDFFEELDDDEINTVIKSYDAIIVSREEYNDFKSLEKLVEVIDNYWPDTLEHAEDLLGD